MSKNKELFIEVLKSILDIEGLVSDYLSKIKHVLGKVSSALSTQVFFVKASLMAIGALAGLYKMIRKNKSKSMVSRVAKTVMFATTLTLTILSVAMISVLGIGNTGMFLLAAVAVNLSRKAFGFMRSRSKLKKLKKLKLLLDNNKELNMSDSSLKKLMKSEDISIENLKKTIDARIEKLESKVKSRGKDFKMGAFDLMLTVGLIFVAFVNPLAAFVISVAALGIGAYQIYKIAKSKHTEKVENELELGAGNLGNDHASNKDEGNQNDHVHLLNLHEKMEKLEEKLSGQHLHTIKPPGVVHEVDDVTKLEEKSENKHKSLKASNDMNYKNKSSLEKH